MLGLVDAVITLESDSTLKIDFELFSSMASVAGFFFFFYIKWVSLSTRTFWMEG